MAFIGLRIPDPLDNALERMMKDRGMSKSEIIRDAIERFIVDYYAADDFDNWKPIAWNLFGIDSHKLNYALSRAETPDEFFSYVDRWTKFDLKIIPSHDKVIVRMGKGGISVQAEVNRKNTKDDAIRMLIEALEQKYNASIVDEI